jgi:hypothetical protein
MRDDRPERERYQRASLAEQLGNELESLARNPKVLLVFVIVVGGAIAFRIITPSPVAVADLRPGDCLYVRTAAPGLVTEDRPIGPDPAVAQSLLGGGAERAACDQSHSHEVSAVFPIEGGGDPPAVTTATALRPDPRCDAAFVGYAGRALEGSGLVTSLLVPDADAWRRGLRQAVCLVYRVDGHYMPARLSAG